MQIKFSEWLKMREDSQAVGYHDMLGIDPNDPNGKRSLWSFDASKVLDQIEAGTASRSLLPYVLSMRGGSVPAIIERWVRIAKNRS